MKWSVAFLLIVAPASALAFGVQRSGGYDVKWSLNTQYFELDYNGSSDINDGSDIAAVTKGAQDWTNVSCSALTVVQSQLTTADSTVLFEGYTDGVNRLVWIEDSRWNMGQWVLGVTAPITDYYGEIQEADIAFNGYATRWSTSNQPTNATDVESVAVHELGHFLGLQHVLNGEQSADPSTMAPSVDPYLRTRDLTPDDQSALCYLYPADGTYSCAGDCDCPMVVGRDSQGQEFNEFRVGCSAGSCGGTASGGGGAQAPLGGGCNGNPDCSGSLFCQPTGYGSYCSQMCDPATASSCPSGFSCYPYQGSNDGACLPDTVGTGGGGGGETCLASSPSLGTGSNPGGNPGTNPGTNPGSNPGSNPGTGSNPGGGGSQNPGGGGAWVDPCPCDTTTACSDDCDCDPECGKGCAATSQGSGSQGGPLALSIIGLAFLGRRVRRRR